MAKFADATVSALNSCLPSSKLCSLSSAVRQFPFNTYFAPSHRKKPKEDGNLLRKIIREVSNNVSLLRESIVNYYAIVFDDPSAWSSDRKIGKCVWSHGWSEGCIDREFHLIWCLGNVLPCRLTWRAPSRMTLTIDSVKNQQLQSLSLPLHQLIM